MTTHARLLWIGHTPACFDARRVDSLYSPVEGDLVDRSTAVFCRDVADAQRSRRGFRATQVVAAGPIEVEALVRVHGRSISVDYRRYVSPLLDLEARLTGNVEYDAVELLGVSLHLDRGGTWIQDSAGNTATLKPYRALMEPLPGAAVLGDLDFLRDLPHDFLLREESEETIGDRVARVIGLKPRTGLNPSLLRTVSFPLQRASVAFDTETLFPLRIRAFPAPGTSLHALVGAGGTIEILYQDVAEASEDEPPAFSPPEDAHVFREETLPIDELVARAPFAIPLELYRSSTFAASERGTLTIDDTGERAHGTLLLEGTSKPDTTERSLLTLRFGNYLARDMARRNVALSEEGRPLEIAGRAAKLLDRRTLWEAGVPGADTAHAPIEIAWQQDGVYWFAIGHRLNEETFLELVEPHLRGVSDSEETATDETRDA